MPAAVFIGFKVLIGRPPRGKRDIAEIFWRGTKVAEVCIKRNEPVVMLFASQAGEPLSFPSESFRSALGLAETRLKNSDESPNKSFKADGVPPPP